MNGKKTPKRAHFESPLVQDTPELSTPKRGNQDLAPIPQSQPVKLGEKDTPTTPRRTPRVSRRRLGLDTPGKGQEDTLDTPRRSSRSSNKRALFDTSGHSAGEASGTPGYTSKVSKKRVLLDVPDQPASARVSKRRKTPAIKKRGGARRVNDEDDTEDFSR